MARSHFPSRRAACVLAGSILTAVVALAGCGGAAAPSAPAPGSVTVPEGALVQAGQITFCSDISAPPLTFYDAAQAPVGVEIELGNALAAELGVRANWANTSFNGIIPALQARQCDAIISQLYIKPEREAVVDFVPYMYASNTLMVASGNTAINGVDDHHRLPHRPVREVHGRRPARRRHPAVHEGQRRPPATAARPRGLLRHHAGDRRVRAVPAARHLPARR